LKSKQVAVVLSLLLILMLPIATAQLEQMREDQIEHVGTGKTGMLSGGITMKDVKLSDNEYTYIDFSIVYFNTNTEDVTYKPYPMAFWEEREHTVKEDYTYYLLPDLEWVTIEDTEFTIPQNHKYYVNVTVKMPTEEAREKSKDGGFIFLISSEAQGGQISIVPARKIFLTIEHTNMFSIAVFGLMILVILLATTALFYVHKKVKILVEEENG